MTEANFWNKCPYDVIFAPIVSEKLARLEGEGKYIFFVDPHVSKTEIKQATEAIFDMEAVSVNTQSHQGKARRTRNGAGRRKNTKCATISLREGSIDTYGDVVD